MTKIEAVSHTAKTWSAGAAATVVVLGASRAFGAGTAIDVPAQVFPRGQASFRPVAKWKWRPEASNWDHEEVGGRSFGVNVPVGAGRQLPLTVHLLSSEAQRRDSDVTRTAEEQDDDFARGAATAS